MKRVFLAGSILLCLVAHGLAVTSTEQLVRESFDQHLYLTASELMKGPMDQSLPPKKIKKWKNKIVREIQRMETGSYLERLYAGGYEAWQRSDKEEILRLWGRFLDAVEQLEPDEPKAILTEIKSRVAPLKAEMAPPKKIIPAEMPPTSSWAPEIPKAVKLKMVIPGKKLHSRRSKSSKAFNRVVKRAEEERSAGRLESALWLYQQANRMDPESKLIEGRLKDLSEEMEVEKP